MRVPITTEALLTGAILKFGSIDYLDMVLLMGGLGKYSNLELIDLPLEFFSEYMKEECGRITLKDGVSLDADVAYNSSYSLTLKRKMEKFSGKDVKEYLDNLDLKEFVLRKIGNGKDKEVVFKYYNDILKETILKLINEGYIETKWEDMTKFWSSSFGSFFREVINITSLGKLYLFKKDFVLELKNFARQIKAVGYDPCFLDDYLLENLDNKIGDIFRVNSYGCFYLTKTVDFEELDMGGLKK